MAAALRLARQPDLLADLHRDIGAAVASAAARFFIATWVAAAAFIVMRRGSPLVASLTLIAVGCTLYGFIAWFAGRNPGAEPHPDPVRAPRLELVAVLGSYLGVLGYLLGVPWSLAVLAAGGVVWALVAAAAGLRLRDQRWLVRGWLPFVPLLLAVAVPKLLPHGPGLFTGALAALPSGVLQQMLLQVGLTARLEAASGRADVAAVGASLLFGLAHAPLNLPQAGGDWSVALANAIVLQGAIGLVFCVGFLRHRAPLALGAGHALAMA